MNSKKKLGVALVGLGYYATELLATALQQTEHCYLAAVVTGTPSKIPFWKEKYNIPDGSIYNYENFGSIKDNTAVDIVYVVLPNHLHAAFTIRSFEAGKHVICEKPMALLVEECDVMIAAAEKAGKNLSIGYRLHFDPYNMEMVRLAKENVYGKIKSIDTAFGILPPKGVWRLDKKIAGGGPLMDVGIYCLQAVCYITGQEPVAVAAQVFPVSDTEKFNGIEETLEWQMKMPDGLAARCRTSYSEDVGFIKVETEKGWFQLNPAFNYRGLQFSASDGYSFDLPPFSQQAKQIDGIALSIKNNLPSIVPGQMGRRDVKIIEAIYKAAASGGWVDV
jgi:predicted dehydrogenase